MSAQNSKADSFGTAIDDPLCLHDPDRGIVIDVWDRTDKRHEDLTAIWPYRVVAAKEQKTQFDGVFSSREAARKKARDLTHDL